MRVFIIFLFRDRFLRREIHSQIEIDAHRAAVFATLYHQVEIHRPFGMLLQKTLHAFSVFPRLRVREIDLFVIIRVKHSDTGFASDSVLAFRTKRHD